MHKTDTREVFKSAMLFRFVEVVKLTHIENDVFEQ